MGISNIHDALEGEERRERAIQRNYEQLVRRLDRITSQLETMGENDMGLLVARLAGRFHRNTAGLRNLVQELQQSVYWPGEVTK